MTIEEYLLPYRKTHTEYGKAYNEAVNRIFNDLGSRRLCNCNDIEKKLSNILESIKYTESIGIARIKIENLLDDIKE